MRPPNLLFIFTDEQRCDTMAAYGNDRIHTPNLNRLAQESVVFERAYVTQPVCTPSRSSIMTGLYPHTNGCTENNVPLKPETKCLAEMLAQDYVSGYHGKWHLGDQIFRQHGFGEWRSVEDMYIPHYKEGRDREARSDYHHFLIENGFTPKNGSVFGRGETARFPEEFSKPAFLAREAARFLKENADRPFCLFVNYLEPHMPFFGPRDSEHDPSEVTLPANFEARPTESNPLKTRVLARSYHERGSSGLPLRTEADWRRMIANYWGLVSLVDDSVGRILAALDEGGLSGNTIVCFTSDHGDMMGSHRLLAKCVQFEEAIRVPLVMRVPGAGAKRIAGPVSQIDLVPTLLELMGQRVPEHLEGESVRSAIEGEGKGEEIGRDVFVEWNGPNVGFVDVRGKVEVPDWMLEFASREEIAASVSAPTRTVLTREGWKLNLSAIGEHELYDLQSDPLELDNLWARQKARREAKDLAARIHEWQARTGDEVELHCSAK